jgi:hypothetical protein
MLIELGSIYPGDAPMMDRDMLGAVRLNAVWCSSRQVSAPSVRSSTATKPAAERSATKARHARRTGLGQRGNAVEAANHERAVVKRDLDRAPSDSPPDCIKPA